MTWKVSTAGNGSNRRHLAQVNFVQLAGVLIIGSAGVIVLGLKGYWEPGVPLALALIFGLQEYPSQRRCC
jgi:hypothetical protein